MSKKLARFLPKGKFARALTLLSGGTLLGQLCLVAVSPILTRLFTPEDFGVLAVFAAFLATISVILALRYDFAQPVGEDDREAASITLGAAWIVVINTSIILAAVYFLADEVAAALDMPALAPLLWLFPPTILVYGWLVVLTYWSLRRQTFKLNSISKLVLGGTQAAVQLLLGYLAFGAPGLIVGYATGILVQFLYLFHGTRADDRRMIFQSSREDVFKALKKHWRYPVLYAPSALMSSAAQLLPPVFLAIVYGPALAGLFALGQRVVGMPVRMLSHSAGQVFLSEMPKLTADQVEKLFIKSSWRFLALGAVGMLPLIFIGPELFAFVFGEKWRESGVIVGWLVPLYISRFVVMSVSQVLNVLNQQSWHLIMSSLSLIALAGSFTAGSYFQWNYMTTIACYSLSWTVIQIATWLVSWRAVCRSAKSA